MTSLSLLKLWCSSPLNFKIGEVVSGVFIYACMPSVHLFIHRSMDLPFHLSTCTFIYLSMYLFVCINVTKQHFNQHRFLQYDDFPPNPMKGMEVPPTIVSITPLPTCGQPHSHAWFTSEVPMAPYPCRFYTESLLIAIPVPDFSMPFNVITLSCTLLAFFFGTMLNFLVKKSGKDSKQQKEGEQGDRKERGKLPHELFGWLQSRFGGKERFGNRTEDDKK